MVETSCKKCYNKEVIEHTDSFHFTWITDKNPEFSFKIGDFQHLPCFCSIREAPWMQIFVILQPM